MSDRTPVPCGHCTSCCRNELLFLHPEMGDKPASYLTKPAFNPVTGRAGLALQQKANGDCIYLGDKGCTIHDRAPAICREFDCRRFYLKMKQQSMGRYRHLYDGAVMQAGKARLRTLEDGAP